MLTLLANRDAAHTLDCADVPHGLIISTDRDSILFLGEPSETEGCARTYTAWLHKPRFAPVKVVLVQDGFVAEPPPDLHPPVP